MKYQQGLFINKDKCLACKLFSAPLFFFVGAIFSAKNYSIWRETPKLGRVFLILIPFVMYIGGAVNTYQAFHIFKGYEKDKELWLLMEKEGAFNNKEDKECL